MKEDMFGGVTVELANEKNISANEFASQLERSMEKWKSDDKRGLWLKIPIAKSDFIPAAVAEGFKFHHAQPDYVMMDQWLPDSESMLPLYPHHQVKRSSPLKWHVALI